VKRVICVVAMFALCLTCSGGLTQAKGQVSDDTIRSVLSQARDLINADKLDEAIQLLEPLAPVVGDRLVYLPPRPSYELPADAPAPPPVPTSVVQCLGAAYWGKRDAAHALPYLEIVAARIPPDQDSLILGTVLECRRILARQARRSFSPAGVIDGRVFARGVIEGGMLFVPAERIAAVAKWQLHQDESTRSWELAMGTKKIALSFPSGGAPAQATAENGVPAREVAGTIMIAVRPLAAAVGGDVSWDEKLGLAYLRLPQAPAAVAPG